VGVCLCVYGVFVYVCEWGRMCVCVGVFVFVFVWAYVRLCGRVFVSVGS